MFWEETVGVKNMTSVDVAMDLEGYDENDWDSDTFAALASLSNVSVEDG